MTNRKMKTKVRNAVHVETRALAKVTPTRPAVTHPGIWATTMRLTGGTLPKGITLHGANEVSFPASGLTPEAKLDLGIHE
jgi:hypothetical protein